MTNVNWKYFQITKDEDIEFIESALGSSDACVDAVKKLCKKVGAREVYQFRNGEISHFDFYGTDDYNLDMKTTWKRANGGWLPRAKTELKKEIDALPKITDANDVCKRYGLGGEMVIGERGVRGYRMHSSYIKGFRFSGVWFICVPYHGDFEKQIDESLKEVKEWEMLKELDGIKQAL